MAKQRLRFTEIVRTILPIALLAAGFFGFLVLKQRERVPARPKEAKPPLVVETMAVRRHSGPVTIQTHGEVVPYREVIVSAEVAGRVIEKTEQCRAGRFVRKGQLLLQIDPKDYELERRRLAAELAQAEVDLRQIDVEMENTQTLLVLAQKEVQLQESEWKRQVNLLARGATSPASVDQAQRSLLQARNSEQNLRNQLNLLAPRRQRLTQAKELAAIRLEQADLNLARTRVVAPVDGVIVTESVQEDAFVQKGTALATIHDTSAVEVQTQLRMEELFWIWNDRNADASSSAGATNRLAGPDALNRLSAELSAGEKSDSGESDDDAPHRPSRPRAQARWAEAYRLPPIPVTVVYELAGRTYAWDGVLSRYDGAGLDERTRTVPCRVLVEDPQAVRRLDDDRGSDDGNRGPSPLATPSETGPPALMRGMFVTLRFHVEPDVPLFDLPEKALRPGNQVLRVRDGRLKAVSIRVLSVANHTATVRVERGELREGDEVAVSPVTEYVENLLVEPRRVDADEVAAAEPSRSQEMRTP